MSAHVLESSIREVTVYRRGAIVVREAELGRTGAGFPEELHLVGLPLTLDDASLRLEVQALEADADAAVPIAGDLRITLAVPPADPRLPPPDDEALERAELEHARAQRTLDDLQWALERARELDVAPRGSPEQGQPPAVSPTSARLDLLTFRRERVLALQQRIEDARTRVHQTEERLATLRERRRTASTHRNARPWELRKVAVVRLEPTPGVALPDAVRIRLRYAVDGARWAPSYVVRLDPRMARARLELRAVVGQATGEDWQGVRLRLSTACKDAWTELPELHAQRIGRTQPEPAKSGWRPPPVGAAELYADYDRDLHRAPVPPPSPVPRPASTVRAGMAGASAERPTLLLPAAAPAPSPGLPPHVVPVSAPPADAAPLSRSAAAGGLGAMLGSAIDGLAGFGRSEDAAGAEASDEPPQLASITADRSLLEYGRLRLSGPEDARRGRLHRVEDRVAYTELAGLAPSAQAVGEGLQAARAAARAMDGRDAPARHRWPSSDAGFDYVYSADAPLDVASDGKLHSVPIVAQAQDAELRFVAVPRETQDVFRTVVLRNPLAAPLLPGPADVYVGGRFTLSSELELTPVGGRIELGLGVEQALRIARNVDFVEDTSGLIKRQLELRHTVRIEIVNHLSRAARVEVRERLPVPARDVEEDVQIETVSVQPAWEDYTPKDDPLEGGKVWKVEVGAAQRCNLSATWVIRIPSQQELVGGNRRER